MDTCTTMDEFSGLQYVLQDIDNFEDYLIFIGIGYLARKVALKLKQTHRLTVNPDGTYTFEFISPLASSTNTFSSGVEFDEVKPDGVKVRATMTIQDNIMTHTQEEENGRTSHHIREFYADRMVVTTTADGFNKTVKRYYVVEN